MDKKIISNCNEPENKCPSSVCDLVNKGKVSPEQLYCCSDNDCLPINDLTSYYDCEVPNTVSKCHNLTTLDACRRNDSLASRVCGWDDSLFCLSTPALIIAKRWEYEGYLKATKWMIDRGKLEDSQNLTDSSSLVTVCDYGQGYQLCNDTSNSNTYLKCGDLFQNKYSCNWHNATKISDGGEGASVLSHPLGEVCEMTPTPTTTVTITETVFLKNNHAEIGLGVGGFGLAACFAIGSVVLLKRIHHHIGRYW